MPAQNQPHLIAEKIRKALEANRYQQAIEILLDYHPVDQADAFNNLDEKHQQALLRHLDVPATADLFDELEDEDTLEASASLSVERLADVLDEMDPDEAADLLGDLPPARAAQALAEMEDPADVLPLLGYPDETAGGRMTTSYIALRRHTTAQQAIEFLRQVGPDIDVPYYLFVIDRENRLSGVVGLRDLVIADPHTRMERIMDSDVIFVTTGTDQEEAARTMARYNLSALPVVDEQRRLVGVITGDDLIDVLEEEATEDIYRLANVSDIDLDPESPVVDQLKGRLPWLFVNTATALFASWVLSRFEGIIAQVAVLAVFQSVVAGQGGNAGSQAVAMIVRALALGKASTRNLWNILTKQVLVGLLQGVVVGLVVGLGVTLWRGNVYLGLVLWLALIGNMIVAGIAGALAPLTLKAIGQDPAIASSVLVTAVTDSFGFFIFLSIAKIFLSRLQ